MESLKPKTVHYRRKREQKTNYLRRRRQLVGGKPRLVVRFTNSRVIAQVVEFTVSGDKVIAGVDSTQLVKHGWKYSLKNTPAAYLTGMLIARKAKAAGCTEAILDLGFKTPLVGSKIYAVLKGALEAGLKVPSSTEVVPSEARLTGAHISAYVSKAKGAQFAQYLKNKVQSEQMASQVKTLAATLVKA